jgi:hypothetical protein
MSVSAPCGPFKHTWKLKNGNPLFPRSYQCVKCGVMGAPEKVGKK